MQKISDLSSEQKKIRKAVGWQERRNDSLFDVWSLTHIGWGIMLGWYLDPFIALVILVLWEPLEILVLSPLLKRYFGIVFGYETIRNSLSDIFFDIIGVMIGAWVLGSLI